MSLGLSLKKKAVYFNFGKNIAHELNRYLRHEKEAKSMMKQLDFIKVNTSNNLE